MTLIKREVANDRHCEFWADGEYIWVRDMVMGVSVKAKTEKQALNKLEKKITKLHG